MTKPDLMAELAEASVVAYAWRKEGMNGWALGHNPPTPNMPDFDKYEVRELTFRTHHAELEAVVRDARGERSESWEVWQDDECVAGSDSLSDAQHFMWMYGQDGPVKMVHVITHRADVIETVPAEQLAAMHNSAREG